MHETLRISVGVVLWVSGVFFGVATMLLHSMGVTPPRVAPLGRV